MQMTGFAKHSPRTVKLPSRHGPISNDGRDRRTIRPCQPKVGFSSHAGILEETRMDVLESVLETAPGRRPRQLRRVATFCLADQSPINPKPSCSGLNAL